MPERSDRPRPHGDPLEAEVVEPNAAQRQSDAPDDPVARDGGAGIRGGRAGGRGSTANGIPASDKDDGGRRKRQYDEGAEQVSRID